MPSTMTPIPFWDALADEHRAWLAPFDPQHLAEWEKEYKADYEAAMCEAGVRRLLQARGVTVQPNLDLTGSSQSPDFKCSYLGQTFFVETACIHIDTATRVTTLQHPMPLNGPAQSCGSLNNVIFRACQGKTTQCDAAQGPCLIAVGTFHTNAAAVCLKRPFADWLLTGEASIAWDMDMETGQAVGDTYQTTNLRSATFLAPTPTSIRDARSTISGILLCQLPFDPPNVMGVLHPNALRPFDVGLLPDVTFGRVLVDRTSGLLTTQWSNEC